MGPPGRDCDRPPLKEWSPAAHNRPGRAGRQAGAEHRLQWRTLGGALNDPICGQVIRCIPTALMPSGIRTRCDRATNVPPSITSVTLCHKGVTR